MSLREYTGHLTKATELAKAASAEPYNEVGGMSVIAKGLAAVAHAILALATR